jgi:hydrogenase 3 maturation protease
MINSNDKKEEIEDDLKIWLSNAKRVIVAGIGNPLRKDDFVGVEIVRKLNNQVSKLVRLIECEDVPESFIEPIAEFEPTHILIIDAAMLNLKPGESKLIEVSELIEQSPISTHALPLRIFCEYLAKTTGAKIALLLMQPQDTGFGEGLTSKLRETATTLTNLLLKFLP